MLLCFHGVRLQHHSTTDGPTSSDEGGDPTPTTLARIEHAQQRNETLLSGVRRRMARTSAGKHTIVVVVAVARPTDDATLPFEKKAHFGCCCCCSMHPAHVLRQLYTIHRLTTNTATPFCVLPSKNFSPENAWFVPARQMFGEEIQADSSGKAKCGKKGKRARQLLLSSILVGTPDRYPSMQSGVEANITKRRQQGRIRSAKRMCASFWGVGITAINWGKKGQLCTLTRL